jgi:WD40 repeat protein
VQIWDLKTGRLAHQWPGKEDLFLPMAAFSPDSQKLVLTRSGDPTRVLDVASGKELWQGPERISASKQDVYAFTPDGKTLLDTGLALGNVIHRYEMATGKRLLAPGETRDTTRKIAFAPDERTLYTLGYNFGPDNRVLRSWDTRTGKQKSRFDVGWGVEFSQDGQIVAAINDDDIHIFDSSTGKERWHLTLPFKLQSWNISFDGKLLAAFGQQTQGQKGHALILWNLKTGKEIRRFSVKDTLWRFTFTSDGQSVIGQPWPSGSSTPSPLLQSLDLVSGQERSSVSLPANGSLLSFSPDGKTVALMCEPPAKGAHLLLFVEVIAGLKRMEIDMSQIGRTWSWPPTFASSPNGNFFLLSDAEGQMHVLDGFSGQRIRTVSGHGGSFSSYSFSPSGRLLATVSANDSTGLVWDAAAIFGGLRPSPLKLSPNDVSGLWDDLGSKDATRAFQAVGRLTLAQRQTIPWFREYLKPFPTGQINMKRLDRLLADLDNDQFAVREKASKEIEGFGLHALPALEKALERNPSTEARRRMEAVMERIGPERIRPLRAIEVLEHIGTSEAEDLLKKLASGAPEARPTQEAKASLNRLANRSSGSP